MCGNNPTLASRSESRLLLTAVGAAIALSGLLSTPASAQMEGVLEEIRVTAQKREEALQDVPISVATTSGEKLNAMFSGSEDVLALSGRVPGLYAESSNGRAAPRFYLRGLGNIDFDLAASQPVSYVMDEVVMENVVLKSFPLFDVQNVEVIRGPQGTLFGRNTIAGIVKINTRRPSEETSGYAKASWAENNTINLEGAVGGSLGNTVNARISGLYRSRDNWITNANTGEEALGEYDEKAVRVQFDFNPSDSFNALLSLQTRKLEGTSSIFRANVFTTGSNDLNQNYSRDTVWYDGGDNNPQGYDSTGITLNLTWDLDNFSINSITSFQDADGSSRGDIDGGVVDFTQSATPPPGITSADIDIFCVPGPCVPVRTWPGAIWVPSVTEDGAETEQFTQEFRVSSDTDGALSWQAGAFFFDSKLTVTTDSFASYGFDPTNVQHTRVQHQNQSWGIFGQGSYDVSDQLTLTAGVRYTDDQKDFEVKQFGQLWLDLGIPTFIAGPIDVSDDQTSWELSANYAVSDQSSLYGRVASGFRAQTIQGRDVAFLETPSVAKPETITSFEAGYKADLANDRLRINLGVFTYEVEDMQLSVIGGASNTNQVVNAAKGTATGFELDLQWLVTDNLLVSGGFAFNDTELKDANLFTAPCGSGMCTVLDPVNPDNTAQVSVNGNPFPRAPETTYNLEIRYGMLLGNNAEIYFLTDWVWYGKINMPLYEAVEFKTKDQFEGGLRVAYKNFDSGLEVALFGRNITDEDNVLGFIDFSNNTGFVNEPSVWGLEVGYEFGD